MKLKIGPTRPTRDSKTSLKGNNTLNSHQFWRNNNLCYQGRMPLLNISDASLKYAKLVDAKVFLCCALFIDVLPEVRNFSLKIDISITDVVEVVENTKQNYRRLLKHVEKDQHRF